MTGVGGQLGHDCVNEAVGRGHECIGSDIAESYSGVQDGSPVTKCSYVQLDITDEKAVKETIERLKPDAIIHCAAWTAVNAARMKRIRRRCTPSMWMAQDISLRLRKA